jgi:hypothetical protein
MRSGFRPLRSIPAADSGVVIACARASGMAVANNRNNNARLPQAGDD